MMEPNEMVDPEALAAFLGESDDSLAGADLAFVMLEADAQDAETINGILRAIHNIKGNSPFFGLLRVKRLAHQMEDLLALMRERRVLAGHTQISCLLAGLDLLKAMLCNVRQGAPELTAEGDQAMEVVLQRLKDATSAGSSDVLKVWSNVWLQLGQLAERTTATDLSGAVESLHRSLLVVAPSALPAAAVPPTIEPLAELQQLLAPSFDDVLPEVSSRRIEALLGNVATQSSGERAQIANLALGEYRSLMAAVGFVPLLRETLLERVWEMQAVAPQQGELTAPALGKQRPATQGPERTREGDDDSPRAAPLDKQDVARTMRVEENRIDEFLDYVGELIITREMFGNVGKRLRLLKEHSGLSSEFQRAMGAFTALSHNLQRSIMEIRKVPIKLVLQKVPRMVRDIAQDAGKEARVTLTGSEISVDKSLVESFEAPLVHMVRNAVDHGLELPADRARRNKPAAGHVRVVVSETSAEIVCAIHDDGGGIDVNALRERAVRLGMMSERSASQLSHEQVFQLVFEAGLSTAKQVTEVSGRGVGMDVVKRNVTELGGRIEIASEPGVGSTFTIHLPKAVTVQILEGFLVQVGEERLVLPLRAISESFRPTLDQLHTVAGRGECVSRRGRVFPLVRFNRLLALGAEDKCPSKAIVVSIEVSGGRSAGLLVDQVLGVQQVVLREVVGIDTPAQVFAGGAVLGDGRVAMVVDVERLGALVTRSIQA